LGQILDMDKIQVTLWVDGHRFSIAQRLKIRDSTRPIDACRTQNHVLDASAFEPPLGLQGIDRTGSLGLYG
jgi:hypothetical protein